MTNLKSGDPLEEELVEVLLLVGGLSVGETLDTGWNGAGPWACFSLT